jgi:hypothetical protein
MKKNEKLFTLNKPGRQFNERMNERQNERTKLFSSSGKLDLNNAFEVRVYGCFGRPHQLTHSTFFLY